MKTYLITGAAGFIGANFIKYMLAKYPEIKIVVLVKVLGKECKDFIFERVK